MKRICVLGIVVVALSGAQWSTWEAPSSPSAHQEQAPVLTGSYDDLAPAQRRLVVDWFRQYNEIMGENLVAREAYEKLPVSTRTTFEAVTHALMQTELTDDEGQSLGTAMDLVAQIETVRGKVPNTGGDFQFRVLALLRPDAVSVLNQSEQFILRDGRLQIMLNRFHSDFNTGFAFITNIHLRSGIFPNQNHGQEIYTIADCGAHKI